MDDSSVVGPLGLYQQRFSDWHAVMASVNGVEAKLTVLESCIRDVGQYVDNGLDKVAAVDELHRMAENHGIIAHCGEDHFTLMVHDGFKEAREDTDFQPDWSAPPPPAPEKANGQHRQQQSRQLVKVAPPEPRRATVYVPPAEADIPKREWLHAMHYMRGICTATVAPGGFGKTTLSLHEAVTMAAAGCKVWYISAEDDRTEIDRRIAAHLKKHKVKPLDIAGRLFIDDKASFPFKIAKSGRLGIEFDELALAAFEGSIKDSQIDVVIFDPFVSFHYLNENDTSTMDALVKRLGEIAARHQCCIELSHHVRKPSIGQLEITVYDARGAGAIVNAVRSCRVLNQMTLAAADIAKVNPDERFRYIRIDSGKRNMAPPETARWVRLVNMELENGDHVQALEEWIFPKDVTTEDDVAWLRVVLAKPMRVSSQSPDWIGQLIAARFGYSLEEKSGIKQVQRKLKRWAAEGLITQDDTILDDLHRKPRPHWVLTEKVRDGKPPAQSSPQPQAPQPPQQPHLRLVVDEDPDLPF